jgi:hypothetical protein
VSSKCPYHHRMLFDVGSSSCIEQSLELKPLTHDTVMLHIHNQALCLLLHHHHVCLCTATKCTK